MQEVFNRIFDHTILKPSTTEEDLRSVCQDAVTYGFCSVAVNTGLVRACADMLRNSDVKVDAAVGFLMRKHVSPDVKVKATHGA